MMALILAAVLTNPYPAKVVKCYDGDTCTFDLNIGFGIQTRQSVRFCDVDAPEMKTATKDAAIRSRDWVLKQLHTAKVVTVLVAYKRGCSGLKCELKSFDRVLGRVFADGVSVNGLAVESGHAAVSDKKCP